MKISWRDKKTNEEVLKREDERLYIVPTIKKRKIAYFGHMIRRNNIHRQLLEGPLEGKLSRGRLENGVVDKHHRMDGNAIPRPRENCSRSGAMEDHDSQPSQRRRHLMMSMVYGIHMFIVEVSRYTSSSPIYFLNSRKHGFDPERIRIAIT